MGASPGLTERVRAALADVPRVTERKMFSGITFMVNGKMCVSVGPNRLMCRIDPALHDELTSREGVTGVRMKGRVYRGFVYVSEDAVASKGDLDYWVGLSLAFNKEAKASRARKRKSPSKAGPRARRRRGD